MASSRSKIFVGICRFSIILVICSSCSSPRRSTDIVPLNMPQNQGFQTSTDAGGSNDPLGTKFFEGNPRGAKAWQQFIAGSQYRLARFEDFHFSDAAIKDLVSSFGDSWRTRVNNPYTGGEINHDSFYHDAAFIVVDNTRNNSKRFGLIIFNEQERDRSHKKYWLYKERDLSQTVFGWDSSGLHLDEYNQHGESATCYVNWNESKQSYSCDKTPRRP